MNTAPLITVLETSIYLSRAKGLLSEQERDAIVTMLAANPTCGDLIVGGGGIRKVRFAIEGKGKSGGARVIYFFHSADYPVLLLSVYAKSVRATITKAEASGLAKLGKIFIETYGVSR